MTGSHSELVGQALTEIDALVCFQRRAFSAHSMHREISLPQIYLLIKLQEQDRLTVSELADLLGVSAPSTSAILDRMEEHGLITRSRDAVDRRVVHVGMGERGAALLDEMAGVKRDHMRRLLSVMSDIELRDVINGIEALHRALDRVDFVPSCEPEKSTA